MAVKKEERFVNPYHFIALPKEGVKQGIEEYKRGGEWLTGKFMCHLTTKTPLIIPDHAEKIPKGTADGGERPSEYDKYPFMTIDGRPMIPGSSLRGVIRSTFETITKSCVFTNDDYYFSSRTGVPKEAGLLEKGKEGWKLYEAERYADKEDVFTNTNEVGDVVKFEGGKDKKGRLYVVGEGDQTGYVMRMKRFINDDKASSYSVFEQKGEEAIPIDGKRMDKFIELFKVNIDKYLEGAAKVEAKRYEEKWKEVEEKGGKIPVWYQKIDDNYYFALSQLSRNVYIKKPKDILPASLKSCSGRDELCPACALFGFMSGETNHEREQREGRAMGSRVRFSDAWCEDEGVCKDLQKPLPILSSPRSSSLEFYLKHEKDSYHADMDGIELAGRKFYWHHRNFSMRELGCDTNSKMISLMQYVEAGVRFKFEVYFDGVTKNQLDQLYTALTFGDNVEDGRLCHKIGHAKPLGFGSAKIIVDQVSIRTFELQDGASYRVNDEFLPMLEAVDISDVEKAVNWEAIKKEPIHYPRLEREVNPKKPPEVYKWFAKNRPVKGRIKYFTKLSNLTDEDVTLPYDPRKNKKENPSNTAYSDKGSGADKGEMAISLNAMTNKTIDGDGKNASVRLPKLPKLDDVKRAVQAAGMGTKIDAFKKTLERLVACEESTKGTKYEKYVGKAKELLREW